MKKILMIVLGIVLAVGLVFVIYKVKDNAKFRDGELRSCSVSTGGGMLGGYSGSYLAKNKDGSVTLTVTYREAHNTREVKTVYQADAASLIHVRELVNVYGLYAASKRPYSKHIAYDADSTSVSFSYENGSFRISDNQEISRRQREGFREVSVYLSSLASGNGVTTVEPQTAMLYLKSGYTLQFIVEDAFDGKLDWLLGEKHIVSKYGEAGIVLCGVEDVDFSAGESLDMAARGTIVFDPETSHIIILYEDCEFDKPVIKLAHLNGYADSACPLIAEMEGEYSLYLN